MHMNFRPFVITIALVGFGTIRGLAKLSTADQAAVDAYRKTDYSGCTRFGTMSLVETYRAWVDFQRRFPGRYAAGAKKETDVVIEHLTVSMCACGDLVSVENELQRFLRTFPTSSARAKVAQRLQALRARRSDIRASCVSG